MTVTLCQGVLPISALIGSFMRFKLHAYSGRMLSVNSHEETLEPFKWLHGMPIDPWTLTERSLSRVL